MKLGLKYRAELSAIGSWIVSELDQLIGSLQGSWKVEHKDDDSHGHVHADSLQVGRVSFSNILQPDAFAVAQVNNYNDARLRDAGLFRVSVNGLTEVSLTGIQIPQDENGAILDGRVLVIENIHDSAIVSLEHESTASSPANRFILPRNPASVTGASNKYFCLPKTLTLIVYNSVAARWIVQSRSNDEVLSYVEFASNQANYAPPNFRAARVVRLVPTAANLTISGFDGTGVPVPDRKTIINEGAYRFAILHMNTASTAANRVACPGATMYYIQPRESVDLYRETDNTWHIILKADAWVDVPFDAANFTASAGTWTVDSADVITYSYQIDGNKMTVSFEIMNTDVSAGPISLRIAVPAGRTIARTTRNMCQIKNNGVIATTPGVVRAAAGNTFLEVFRDAASTVWTATAGDNTDVLGQITFMVDTSCATVSEPHQDTAHQDTAHQDAGHTDVAHTDTAHVDSHSDVTHVDTGHGDSLHSDTHSDTAHTDVVHSDSHTDSHTDQGHVDSHTDTPHTDVAHGDNHDDGHDDFQDFDIHFDTHADAHADAVHTDTPFSDSHSDSAHGDSHSDVAHSDVAHSDVAHIDTHSDVAHSDAVHTDTPHSDTHSDTPHTDVAHVDSIHTDTVHADSPHVDVGLHCDTAHTDI